MGSDEGVKCESSKQTAVTLSKSWMSPSTFLSHGFFLLKSKEGDSVISEFGDNSRNSYKTPKMAPGT